MTLFTEGALRFDFDEGWLVEKYDDHADYRRGIERLKDRASVMISGVGHVVEVGTKAVDFVGVRARAIHFIEVKDFRGYRIENKSRVRDGDLAIEVAVKVRDTIAGIIGACRQHDGPARWGPFQEALVGPRPLHVCLWLEEDTGGPRLDRGHPGMTLQSDLQQRLSWLGARVLVANRSLGAGPSGVRVGSLPDGIVELRARMRRAGQITRDEYSEALRCTVSVAGQELKELCTNDVLQEVAGAPNTYRAGKRWLGWP